MGFDSQRNEEVFATINSELREEAWSASRPNTAAGTIENVVQTKESKTRDIRHC